MAEDCSVAVTHPVRRASNRAIITLLEAVHLVARTELRGFTRNDWMAFAECETSNPQIGKVDDWIVIVDGDTISLMSAEDDTRDFTFKAL